MESDDDPERREEGPAKDPQIQRLGHRKDLGSQLATNSFSLSWLLCLCVTTLLLWRGDEGRGTILSPGSRGKRRCLILAPGVPLNLIPGLISGNHINGGN